MDAAIEAHSEGASSPRANANAEKPRILHQLLVFLRQNSEDIVRGLGLQEPFNDKAGRITWMIQPERPVSPGQSGEAPAWPATPS